MNLGWMIIATLPNGRTQALPIAPEAMDALPCHLHESLPTLGGVWVDEATARDVWGTIPPDMRIHFKVVPVTITIMKQGL